MPEKLDFTGLPQLPVPQLRPDVAKALKLAKDNIPPYPTELLAKLGAYEKSDTPVWKQPLPEFREWQWEIDGCWNGDIPYNVSCNLEDGYWEDGIDLSKIGYIGLWRGRTASKTHLIYCVLPSMIHGEVLHGSTIELGTERIRIGWKLGDLDAMIRRGYDIMREMIAEHGEY